MKRGSESRSCFENFGRGKFEVVESVPGRPPRDNSKSQHIHTTSHHITSPHTINLLKDVFGSSDKIWECIEEERHEVVVWCKQRKQDGPELWINTSRDQLLRLIALQGFSYLYLLNLILVRGSTEHPRAIVVGWLPHLVSILYGVSLTYSVERSWGTPQTFLKYKQQVMVKWQRTHHSYSGMDLHTLLNTWNLLNEIATRRDDD